MKRVPRPFIRWTFRLSVLCLALMLALPWAALADVVNNDVTAGGTDTFTLGGSTTVNYKIVATGGDGQSGCNAADGTSAVVTINKPAAVTATPATRTFSACNAPQSVVFTASAAGDYLITASASDTGPGSYNTTPASFTLHVLAPPNSPPTANAGGPYTVSEAGSVALAGSGSDPDGDPLTYAWDLDNNGSYETPGQNPTFSAASIDGPSSKTVVLQVCDNKGACATSTATVNITNVAPTATFNAPASVDEGSPINLSLTSPSDPSSVDTAAGFTYAFDCGDGSGYGSFGAGNSASCPTTDNGSRTVRGKIKDKDGGFTEYTAGVTINNVPPTVNTPSVSPEPSNEGSAATASATFSDPGTNDAPFTCAVNYGDGSGDLAGSVSGNTCTGPAHTYADNGTYPVTVKVTDKDGGTGSNSTSHTVNNLPPVITGVTPSYGALYDVNTSVNVTAVFTDAGTADTHTCTINWDDGYIDGPYPASETSGSGSCTDGRTYSGAGVYTIQVTVTDDDGGSDTRTVMVVVYDPSAGFVTGGGWINSPTGAYTPENPNDPDLTGRANFGFVSKYKKGATTPTGQTEFQFQVANFNFHSDTYQWLVIAGAKAQYKGTGTVNGAAGYGFLLTATDGQISGGGSVDKFRIKIWEIGGAVVYDNAYGASEDIDSADPQAIAGGSVVIHSK